jgi:hypothetical protein
MSIHTGPSYSPVMSSVTATVDKWIDIPAAASASYTDPTGLWDMPSTEYLYTTASGHKKLIEIPVRPGDVIDKYRVDFQGIAANDGIIMRVVKRAVVAAAWTAVDAPVTAWGPAQNADAQTLAAALTVLDGTVYAIEVASVVATTGVKVFSAGFHTTSRSL